MKTKYTMAISHKQTPMVAFGINETYQAEDAFKAYLRDYVAEHDSHWSYKTFINIDTPVNMNRFNKGVLAKQKEIAKSQFSKISAHLKETGREVLMNDGFMIDDNNTFTTIVNVRAKDGKIKKHTFTVKFVLNTCDLDISLLTDN